MRLKGLSFEASVNQVVLRPFPGLERNGSCVTGPHGRFWVNFLSPMRLSPASFLTSTLI